jgi:hypothetical protein
MAHFRKFYGSPKKLIIFYQKFRVRKALLICILIIGFKNRARFFGSWGLAGPGTKK